MAYNPDVDQAGKSGGSGVNTGSAGNRSGSGSSPGNDGESQETKRARRQHAQARTTEIERALADSRGADMGDVLHSLGIYDEKEKGRALWQQYMNLYKAYGTGINPGHQYDWTSGKKWDPLFGTTGRTDDRQVQNPNGDDYYRGGWVPIEQSEYDSKRQAEDRQAQFGDNYNPWRLDRFKSAQDYGHVTKDQASGNWYNDPGNDASKRIWYNDQYQQIGGPSGTSGYNGPTGTGVVGPDPFGGLGSIYDALAMAPPAPVQKRGSGFQGGQIQNPIQSTSQNMNQTPNQSIMPNSGWTNMPQIPKAPEQTATTRPMQSNRITPNRPQLSSDPLRPAKPLETDTGLVRKKQNLGWQV